MWKDIPLTANGKWYYASGVEMLEEKYIILCVTTSEEESDYLNWSRSRLICI